MAKLCIQHNEVFIGATQYPDRKKPSFVVERGNEAIVLGSFRNVEAVDEFENALKELLGGGE